MYKRIDLQNQLLYNVRFFSHHLVDFVTPINFFTEWDPFWYAVCSQQCDPHFLR
jgi:hypothetical protein